MFRSLSFVKNHLLPILSPIYNIYIDHIYIFGCLGTFQPISPSELEPPDKVPPAQHHDSKKVFHKKVGGCCPLLVTRL